MEPATLRFKRRFCTVKRMTRQTLEALAGSQRAATIQRFYAEDKSNQQLALSGQSVPQGVFVVSGEWRFSLEFSRAFASAAIGPSQVS
jgi:hypothetical protein